MSINWVMLDETKGFVPLPRERILFTTPQRTTLSLQSSNSYPGKEPLSIHSSAGTGYLTNQRLVYLPTAPTPSLQSFSAPILNLQDTHVSAPFFGPNVWTGILQPVPGGGIPPQHAFIEIKMTFKDGGAFDFHSSFERIKENLSQAIEMARESGQVVTGNANQPQVDLSQVHLDQLPAYEEIGGRMPAPEPHVVRPTPISPPRSSQPSRDNGVLPPPDNAPNPKTSTEQFEPPNEPPPGYDEAQQSAVVINLEDSIRRAQERES